MKKIVITLIIIAGIVGFGYVALNLFIKNTKKHSPEAIASYAGKDGLILEVAYCQPSKKGREIFGSLVPYDEVWRTGANEATLFTTNKDLNLGGKVLKSGTYSLFTLPSASEWKVIFNEETGQWGTQYDESEDILRAPATVEEAESVSEVFTIKFDETEEELTMLLMWDKAIIQLPITVDYQ